jgi:hypothetical protein
MGNLLKTGDFLDELNIHGRIILKWIFKKFLRDWSGLVEESGGWFRVPRQAVIALASCATVSISIRSLLHGVR